MSVEFGENIKQSALETNQHTDIKETISRSVFDFPQTKDVFSNLNEVTQDLFNKPGSSFNGPWDSQNPDHSFENSITKNGDGGFAETTHQNIEQQQGFDSTLKEQIQTELGWSDAIGNAIHSRLEYEIYKKAGLTETYVDGKPCLAKDIDIKQIDDFGRSNKERMSWGLSPIDKNGETIELHHIGQRKNSPLAELNTTEHRGKGNDTILHDKTKPSEIDRVAFDQERSAHWQERAQSLQLN